MMQPERSLTITEQTATMFLKEWLHRKYIHHYQIISAVRFDVLDYWAFNVSVLIQFTPFIPFQGDYGFHVYDDGSVVLVAHYPGKGKE